jgi:hypothetical protein
LGYFQYCISKAWRESEELRFSPDPGAGRGLLSGGLGIGYFVGKGLTSDMDEKKKGNKS